MINLRNLKVILGFMTIFCFELVSGKMGLAIPLRAGLYYGGGSRYIAIYQKGNIICYSGFSQNGSFIASVEIDANLPDTYNIHNTTLSLLQKDENTLLFGDFYKGQNEYNLEASVNSHEN